MLPADSLNNYTLEGVKVGTVCPAANAHACDKICIGLYSGHYSMLKGSAHKAQIKRSIMFHYDFLAFKAQLFGELASVAALAMVNKTIAYIRLDVFSDNKKANAKLIKEFSLSFPSMVDYLEFYDYTKIHNLDKAMELWGIWGRYGKNLALSVSKEAMRGQLFNDYIKALPKFNYSAIVVAENEVQATIDTINIIGDNVKAVNGDLFDNFTKHENDNNSHIVLVLKGKGSKLTKKAEVKDIFAITEQDASILYTSVFSNLLA